MSKFLDIFASVIVKQPSQHLSVLYIHFYEENHHGTVVYKI